MNASTKRPFNRDQRTTIVYGMLFFVLIVVVLQLWLLTATMNAWLGGDDSIVWPAAAVSAGGLALNVGLLVPGPHRANAQGWRVEGRARHASSAWRAAHASSASTMLTSEAVGYTRVIFSPAAASSAPVPRRRSALPRLGSSASPCRRSCRSAAYRPPAARTRQSAAWRPASSPLRQLPRIVRH